MSARFHNVAEGNISRLRDAQAFHAAVKRPPYFMFARQRRHFTAGRGLPGLSSPLAYIIQNKRKAANTFHFASEINRHKLAAEFFGRILARRPWAFCWLGSMP